MPIPHGYYNVEVGVSSIPDEVRREKWCRKSFAQVQQVAIIHIFRLKRWNGSIESLAEKSKKPHSHPNQHTEEEIKMIRNYRRRNPELGLTELWHRLRKKGYTRRPESIYRVMKKLGLLPNKPKPSMRQPKSYEQMIHPGESVQIDVQIVSRKCITDSTLALT